MRQRIETLLSTRDWELREGIIFRQEEPLGVLVPGVLFGRSKNGRVQIVGPNGCATAEETPDEILAALLAIRGILLGTPDEIKQVAVSLRTPEHSRTFSYLMCICATCEAVLHAHNSFSSSAITILGCGGIGSISAVLLAGAGLMSIRLIDPDFVEVSNLNRQLFYTLADVGRPKVHAIAQQIRARFPWASVDAVQVRATPARLGELCKASNAILMTADEPLGLIHDVASHASKNNIPLVVAGYGPAHGLVTSDWKPDQFDSECKWERSPGAIMPSFGPTNAELAGIAATLLFQILSGVISEEQTKQTYTFNNHRVSKRFAQNRTTRL